MKLYVDGNPYNLTSTKLTDPLLKVLENGVGFGFFTSSPPNTPTILFDRKYLNQPTKAYTKTFDVSLTSGGGLVTANYGVNNVLSANYKLTGTVIMDNGNWIERSGNHGDLLINGHKIFDIGHHFEHGGRESITKTGTLKTLNAAKGNVNLSIGLDGVGGYSYEELIHHGHGDTDHVTHHVPVTTYFKGTLVISGTVAAE